MSVVGGLGDLRLAPAPGSTGLACRFPGVALFVADPRGAGVAGELIERCRDPSTGPDLARSLAEALATAAPDTRPSFALVSDGTDGLAVLVHGALDVTASGPNGPVQIAGADAPAACIEHALPGGQRSVVVTARGATPVEGHPVADLERGVVPASGFVLSPRTSDRTPSPGAAASARPDFVAVSLLDHGGDEDDRRAPLPVVTDPVEVRSAEAQIDQVVVQGIVCTRGHFNDPRSRFCSSCAVSMADQTRDLVSGPRPPLGVLVFDDGTTYSLSANYVVGRQPETHGLVRQGQALPLVLEDDQRTISRAHAEIRLVGWDVHFVNLSATNGSYVWDQQYQQWATLGPGQPIALAAGMRIAMGQRTAVFESALVH